MKTIGSIKGLTDLEPALAKHIMDSCPWMTVDWDAEEFGYVFVLEDSDNVSTICAVPHIDDSDYRDLMTIDLEFYDLWEKPALYDEDLKYWNVVTIFGQDYGCVVFLSTGFVESIPSLHRRLQDIKQVSCRT